MPDYKSIKDSQILRFYYTRYRKYLLYVSISSKQLYARPLSGFGAIERFDNFEINAFHCNNVSSSLREVLRNRCNCSRITSSAATFSNLWRFRAFVYNTELKCRSPRQTQYQQQKRCLPLYKYTNKPLQRRKHTQCPHEEINSANINECLQNTSKQQQTVRNGFGFNANNVKEITRLNTSFPPLQIFSCLQKHLNVACVYLHFWQTMIFWKRQERHWSVEV